MRHTSRKRRGPEALKPRDHPTWLTAHDPFGKLLESRELEPNADLRAVLMGELEKRVAEGWEIEEPPSNVFAGFFCRRDGLRVLVGIAHADPAVSHLPEGGGAWTR